MDDLERGERMKAARVALHLTQPAVVEMFEERAKRDGWEPKKPGERAVTLRGLQAWEGGGGIRWEKAKWLADVLGLDVTFMMTGREESGGPTPDLSLRAVRDEFRPDVDGVQDQLSRIDRRLDAIETTLKRFDANGEIEQQLQTQTRLLKDIQDVVAVLKGVQVEPVAKPAMGQTPIPPGPLTQAEIRARESEQAKRASDRAQKKSPGRRRRAS